MKTPKERDNLDLLELVCELHARSVNQPRNKFMHDTYWEARQELEARLKNLPQAAVSGSTYLASDEMEDELDDQDWESQWEDEMETEEMRRQEMAYTCSCGAWVVSKTTGKAIHVADCICGAE